jgi:hypothetical protein
LAADAIAGLEAALEDLNAIIGMLENGDSKEASPSELERS